MEINNEFLGKILSSDSSKIIIQDWNIETNIAPGSNHSSELSRLTVEYQKKGKTFKKSFILKIPSAHPMYKMGMKFKMYEKEYPIYTEVLEEMYKLDGGEHIGPKLYYADDKHSLMMKDLALSGYKMVDRIGQLDFDQCYLVLKKLAKFHGLSVKLNQDGKMKPVVKEMLWRETEIDELFKKCQENVCELLAKSIDPKFNLYEKISSIKDVLHERLHREVIPDRFTFRVLNHGDLWLGNTLFKFDKYGDPIKVKLIDFQNSSWTSPVIDILDFTISSMRFEVFERYFHVLMEAYVGTLNKTLQLFQCGSYSLEELYRDMDKLPTLVIICLACRLPILLSSAEDSINFRNCCKEGIIDSAYHEKLFKNEVYLKVLNQWISHYVKKSKSLAKYLHSYLPILIIILHTYREVIIMCV